MSDENKPIGEYSDEELVAELARRRARLRFKDMTAIEDAGEGYIATDGEVFLAHAVTERVAAQTNDAKPCPKCGKSCRVRGPSRERTIRTSLGEYTFARHYHYCGDCKRGFYPIDNELGLPPSGELTAKMSARVLDLGVNESYVAAAERWSVHHRGTISEGLVRNVVERVGRAVDELNDEVAQQMFAEAEREPASLLVVETDGSMVPMRGPDAWREAKLGVVFRGQHHVASTDAWRGCITQARYAAVLGSVDEFRGALEAALRVEHVDRASRVAWLGDGAVWNWRLASEICPRATQILDWMPARSSTALRCGMQGGAGRNPIRCCRSGRIASSICCGTASCRPS